MLLDWIWTSDVAGMIDADTYEYAKLEATLTFFLPGLLSPGCLVCSAWALAVCYWFVIKNSKLNRAIIEHIFLRQAMPGQACLFGIFLFQGEVWGLHSDASLDLHCCKVNSIAFLLLQRFWAANICVVIASCCDALHGLCHRIFLCLGRFFYSIQVIQFVYFILHSLLKNFYFTWYLCHSHF